eukprot:Phypoly_transcript_12468.p1 GENE.Phypoly_transcript_12468~~Phypoly_transcript_12468.p1  ORF type:complete len:307 (+),score=31.80 Phypoly_transcript_12468:201-1121(+)
MNVSHVRIGLILVALLLVLANQLWLSTLTQDLPPIPISHDTREKVELLLMVTSHAGDAKRRSIMRETYLSFTDRRYTWMFIIGKQNVTITRELYAEQDKYKDIFFLDSLDGYFDLTDKILKGFEVAAKYFDFKFLLKLDTDTYVNVPKFIDFLDQYKKEKGVYCGVQGVWSAKLAHSDEEQVPTERRSWYMLGGGYALSHDLVLYFAENWHLLHQWKPEDLTIGIHLQYLNIYRVVDTTIFKTDNKEILCDQNYLVNHKASELQMFYLHYSSLITGGMCMYEQNDSLRKRIMVKAIEAHDLLVSPE